MRIFVENARNDRAFLLAFADPDQRRRLEHAEQRGWLVYTGGGIGEIQKALETTMSPSSWFVAHRTWALCDSDAATAGSPGRASTTITHLLRRLERRMGRPAGWAGTALARRAIENYAPPDRVRSWAMTLWSAPAEEVDRWMSEANARLEGGGYLRPLPKVGTPKRRILGALALRSLPPQQRAHLDLKRGKEGTDREQWEKIPEPARTWLDHGLGAGFAAEFYPRFRDLEDDSGELRPLLDQLLRRL